MIKPQSLVGKATGNVAFNIEYINRLGIAKYQDNIDKTQDNIDNRISNQTNAA